VRATFCFAQRASLLFLLAAFGQTAVAAPSSLVRNGDRVVFVGDSITGQGMNTGPGGFVNLFKAGLDAARPDSNVTVVPLGGSGQTVGSWQNVEKQSREKEVFLDVKNVDVRHSLDRKADVLIVMLGMNDTLSPSMDASPASLDAWAGRYRELLAALRARTTPRVTALATITPNTEDQKSPKNVAIAEMNRRVAAIAAEQGCVLLPSGDTIWETLRAGRRCKPDFHVAPDFVHPSGVGHASIAAGMLRGLGETQAAEAISTQHIQKALDAARGDLPCLSYGVVPSELPLGSDEATFEIRAFWTPAAAGGTPRFNLEAPSGWQVTPAEAQENEAVFVVSGKPDRLENVFTLSAAAGSPQGDHTTSDNKKEATITIPAPWLVGTGFANPAAWERGAQDYVPEKGVLPGEERFASGNDFGHTPGEWNGPAPKWSRYLASVDHTGGATPGNVSLCAASFANTFEAGFGARWIHCDREVPVGLRFGSQVFAGQQGVVAWLNGEKLYAGSVTNEPGRKAVRKAVLKPGWNSLVFKANHCQWQWQFSCDMLCDNPDDAATLRISTVPHP
jgi:lysophospholipase L1-like esterase